MRVYHVLLSVLLIRQIQLLCCNAVQHVQNTQARNNFRGLQHKLLTQNEPPNSIPTFKESMAALADGH